MFTFHDGATLLSKHVQKLAVKSPSLYSFRWEVIANYMNQHSTSGMKRNAKDVINKAKNLQRLGTILPTWCSLQGQRSALLQPVSCAFTFRQLGTCQYPFPSSHLHRSSPERWDQQKSLWEVQEGTHLSTALDRQRRALREIWWWVFFQNGCVCPDRKMSFFFFMSGKWKLFQKYVREVIVPQIQLLWACNWLCVHPQRLVVMGTLPPGPQKNRNFWSKPWKPTQWAHLSAGRRSLLPSPGEARKTVWRGTR